MGKDFIKIVWKDSKLPVWLFTMIHCNCKNEDGSSAFSNGYGGTNYWNKERRSVLCEKHEVIRSFTQ